MQDQGSEKKKLVPIGRISKPHGLKGYLFLQLYNKSSSDFPYNPIFIQKNNNSSELSMQVEDVRWASKRMIIKFAHINNRDEAEKIRDSEVLVTEEQLQENLDEDEYYFYQIVGFQVVSVAGVSLGKIISVQESIAQDILVIDYKGREVLIPAIKPFLIEIQLDTGIVIIDPIEGMFELNAKSDSDFEPSSDSGSDSTS